MIRKVNVKIHDHQKKVMKVEKVFEKAIIDSEKVIDDMVVEREEIEDAITSLTREADAIGVQVERSITFTNNLKQLLGYDHKPKVKE